MTILHADMPQPLSETMDPRALVCAVAGVESLPPGEGERLVADVRAGRCRDLGGVAREGWRFAESLLLRMQGLAHFPEPLCRAQGALTGPLLATLLVAPGLLSSADACVERAVSLPLQLGFGLDDALGRPAQEFVAELAAAIDAAVADFRPEAGWWAGLAQTLEAIGAAHRSRVQRLERRLVEAEQGAQRALKADQMVAQLLNLRCEGRQLPAEVVDFLHGPWYQSLRLVCLSEGAQSSAWRDAVRATNNLVRSCAPVEREEQRQPLYRLIAELPEQIAPLLRSLDHQPGQAAHWLEVLSRVHLCLLQGRALNWVAAPQLALHQPVQGLALQVQSELQGSARACEVGQWFWRSAEGEQPQHWRLVAWLADTSSALFCNWLGQRQACLTSEELGVALAAGWMRPLGLHDGYRAALAAVGEKFELESMRASRERAERELAEAERREAEARELASQREAQQARELARQKAEQEAQRLAEIALQASRQQVEQAAGARREEAEAAVASLAVGAWLNLSLAEGQPPSRVKLAVRMPSSGKMVFVDRIGVKVAECSQEELVGMFAAGRAQVHRNEARFEDTLARVVDQMRRERREAP